MQGRIANRDPDLRLSREDRYLTWTSARGARAPSEVSPALPRGFRLATRVFLSHLAVMRTHGTRRLLTSWADWHRRAKRYTDVVRALTENWHGKRSVGCHVGDRTCGVVVLRTTAYTDYLVGVVLATRTFVPVFLSALTCPLNTCCSMGLSVDGDR